MKQTWAQRKHLVVHNIMHLQDVRQLLATYKSQITKVAYKVLQQGPIAWQWLQVRAFTVGTDCSGFSIEYIMVLQHFQAAS